MGHHLLGFALLSLVLCSCASWNSPSERHKGVCNTLKSQLVFGGSTPNPRQAAMQEAEMPLVQHTYDQEKCE
jgi:hypothetical protein